MSSEPNDAWKTPEQLEDAFMQACESDAKAIGLLADTLEGAPAVKGSWPTPITETWASGLELALEGVNRQAVTDTELRLILDAARVGPGRRGDAGNAALQ